MASMFSRLAAGLAAAAALLCTALPAAAQNSYEQGVILFLQIQHQYEDYEPDNQPDWIGRLRRADQNRQVEHTVQLEAGETYRIIGACDVDCNNMDMELFGPDGVKIADNLAPDDHPYIEITPEVSGAYRVHPWVVVCRATPCYGGVRLLRMQPRQRSGTAFLISANGYLLTAAHIVENRTDIAIHTANGEVAAEVVSRDPANDIALLRAEMTGQPLFLASARDLRRGQEVMTLGYPLVEMQGESQKATFGRVNALSGLEDDVRFIQTDTDIQPGNSGGPLLSADGRVVGLMTSTINQRAVADAAGTVAQNVNFALKSDYILPLLPSDALPPAEVPAPLADFEATAAFAEGSVFRITAE